jgi:polar amino acid transport system substrate-binding protein
MAVLDEPPFCWLGADGVAGGCDVEVATIALRRAGVRVVEYRLVTFEELIPGVTAGRWQVNTGMFVTAERRRLVRFTRPVWAVPDGLIVRRADAARLDSYLAIATDPAARLGVVIGQVQGGTAVREGVPEDRLVRFATQEDAVAAVRSGVVDAAASTAIGNRALLARRGDASLAAVGAAREAPVGAFSLGFAEGDLADALDVQLDRFVGTSEHRALMARHGFDALG